MNNDFVEPKMSELEETNDQAVTTTDDTAQTATDLAQSSNDSFAPTFQGDNGEGETKEEDSSVADEEVMPEGIAKYRITGLVDKFDEQGIIVGQYPIDSIQELSTNMGEVAVEEGRAERV